MTKKDEKQKEKEALALNAVTDKHIEDVETILKREYSYTQKRVIRLFQETYGKILNQTDSGMQPSPALLYKLDTYWQFQAQARDELKKLGDKESQLLSEHFEKNFYDVYNFLSLPSDAAFRTLDKPIVQNIINEIWCSDGKRWSDRVWNNKDKLMVSLNDGLLNTLMTGASPDELKVRLAKEFKVSYERADTLVRTELARVQAAAANERYIRGGVKYVEYFTCEDERVCEKCGPMHGKILPVTTNCIPMHCNCRCTLLPIISDSVAFAQGLADKETIE